MPIINFEYSSNLTIDTQIKPFLGITHHVLVDIIKTDLTHCRSTITRHHEYLIADGNSDNAFIQLSVRMLPGRTKETKDKLGHELLTMIKQTFAGEIEKFNTQIRVSLTEIEKDFYYGLA